MNTLQLSECLTDEAVAPLLGTWADKTHYVHGIDVETRVNKPDGSPLGVLLRGAISAELCGELAPILRYAATETDQRGMAAGPLRSISKAEVFGRGNLKRKITGDGYLSKYSGGNIVHSGIIGFKESGPPRFFCRMTAWTMDNFGPMLKAMRLIEVADAALAKHLPERHAAQMEVAKATAKDFRLGETSFTTVTVNRNFRTAYHTDKGDLKAGFGVMCCLRKGQWSGGMLVVPKYKVAFNMRHGDILLMDVHEMHGNTAIIPLAKNWERISCVFYYRERMKECGSAENELEKAKAR